MKNYKRHSVEELERHAREFLDKHDRRDGWRLLIEQIVQDLGYRLIPVSGLEAFGVEAYLAKAEMTIFVDEGQMNYGGNRYCFTLTEEVAHGILHVNGYDRTKLHDEVMALSETEYADVEFDAKYLAAAILMPREQFRQAFNDHVSKQTKALGKSADRQTVIRYAIRKLYTAYCVSFECAMIRSLDLNLITKGEFRLLKQYLGPSPFIVQT